MHLIKVISVQCTTILVDESSLHFFQNIKKCSVSQQWSTLRTSDMEFSAVPSHSNKDIAEHGKPFLKLQVQSGNQLRIVADYLKPERRNWDIVHIFRDLNLLTIEKAYTCYMVKETRRAEHMFTIRIIDADDCGVEFTTFNDTKINSQRQAHRLVVNYLRRTLLPVNHFKFSQRGSQQPESVPRAVLENEPFLRLLVRAYTSLRCQNIPHEFAFLYLRQLGIIVQFGATVCTVKPRPTFTSRIYIGQRLTITGVACQVEHSRVLAASKVIAYLSDLTYAHDVFVWAMEHAQASQTKLTDASFVLPSPLVCQVCDTAFANAKFFLDHQLSHMGQH